MSELLKFIFTIESQVGLSIIWTIVVLFFMGLGTFLWYLLIRLPSEKHQLKIAIDYFKSSPSLGDSDQLTEELSDSGVRKGSVVYKRIERIIEIKNNQGQIDQDALSEVLVGKESVKAGGARYVLSILIILGLIGTLWGLSHAIIEVQPLVTDVELEALTQISTVIRRTLAGMSTAFATTLAGLFTSLFLGVFSWRFNRKQALFLAELEDFTTTTLLPCFSSPVGLDAIQNAAEKLAESTETMKFTAEENVRAMEKAIQQLTDVSWEARLEQQYTLAETFEETTRNLLKSLEGIGSFQFTVEDAVKTFKTSTEQSIKQVTESQGELRDTLNKTLPDLSTESESLKDAITEYQNSQTGFINDLNRTLRGGNDELLQHITDIIADYKNSLTDFTNNLNSAISNGNDALVERLTGVLQNSRGHIDKIVGQQQDMVGMLKEVSGELKIGEHFDRQNAVLQLVADNLNVLSTVTEELRGLRADLKGQNSNELLLGVRNAIERMGRVRNAPNVEIAYSGSEEKEVLKRILQALQELNESVKTQSKRPSFLSRLLGFLNRGKVEGGTP